MHQLIFYVRRLVARCPLSSALRPKVCSLPRQSVEHMARALLRRALSISAAAPATPLFTAAFASSSCSSVAPLRSPFDERLLHLLRSEISYHAERRPPYPPPSSFKSFAVEDRPGEQWVRLRAGAGAEEEVKVEATMFDGAAEPPPEDAPLFQRVESLERGPRLHLSLIVEVIRGDRVHEFICSAWPDELAVRHVATFREDGGSGRGVFRDFMFSYCAVRCFVARLFGYVGCEVCSGFLIRRRLGAADREAVIKFLKDREVDEELAGFLHEYMANKEKRELLRWLKTIESFVDRQPWRYKQDHV